MRSTSVKGNEKLGVYTRARLLGRQLPPNLLSSQNGTFLTRALRKIHYIGIINPLRDDFLALINGV